MLTNICAVDENSRKLRFSHDHFFSSWYIPVWTLAFGLVATYIYIIVVMRRQVKAYSYLLLSYTSSQTPAFFSDLHWWLTSVVKSPFLRRQLCEPAVVLASLGLEHHMVGKTLNRYDLLLKLLFLLFSLLKVTFWKFWTPNLGLVPYHSKLSRWFYRFLLPAISFLSFNWTF